MIKTSSEGTSYCPQCEAYAREIERLKKVVVAAEAFISQDRQKATVQEMLEVDGDLALALAALQEGKKK